ncbi:10 TM domain-containing transmembrane protein [Acrasis kona]|uniref:10 TM domain-containing transmembrane protein n=1 Tax=Acrasis kona TaxID=1008807 RepID=A0AAW2ZCU0_9EUKA
MKQTTDATSNEAEGGVLSAPSSSQYFTTSKTHMIALRDRIMTFAHTYIAYIFAILSHGLFGLHPVFSRYLQHSMQHPLPGFSLMFVAFGCVIVAFSPKIGYRSFKFIYPRLKQEKINMALVKRVLKILWTDFILNYRIWSYVAVVVIRAMTNIFSSRFTSAVYVQLIGLLAPFMVSGITFIFLRNTPEGRADKLTWKTFLALTCTIIGSVLIILGGVKSNGGAEHWYSFFVNFKIDWSALGNNITGYDLLGMGLAFVSNLFLSIYMILVKRLKSSNAASASSFLTDGEGLFLFQSFAISLVALPISLSFENWSPWGMMDAKGWACLCSFICFVTILAQFISVRSIQTLGATTVGSTISLRLVSSIFFSIVIIGETLQTAWQLVGVIIVLVSVSVFLYFQNKQHKQVAMELAKENTEVALRMEEGTLDEIKVKKEAHAEV